MSDYFDRFELELRRVVVQRAAVPVVPAGSAGSTRAGRGRLGSVFAWAAVVIAVVVGGGFVALLSGRAPRTGRAPAGLAVPAGARTLVSSFAVLRTPQTAEDRSWTARELRAATPILRSEATLYHAGGRRFDVRITAVPSLTRVETVDGVTVVLFVVDVTAARVPTRFAFAVRHFLLGDALWMALPGRLAQPREAAPAAGAGSNLFPTAAFPSGALTQQRGRDVAGLYAQAVPDGIARGRVRFTTSALAARLTRHPRPFHPRVLRTTEVPVVGNLLITRFTFRRASVALSVCTPTCGLEMLLGPVGVRIAARHPVDRRTTAPTAP